MYTEAETLLPCCTLFSNPFIFTADQIYSTHHFCVFYFQKPSVIVLAIIISVSWAICVITVMINITENTTSWTSLKITTNFCGKQTMYIFLIAFLFSRNEKKHSATPNFLLWAGHCFFLYVFLFISIRVSISAFHFSEISPYECLFVPTPILSTFSMLISYNDL